MSDEQIMPGPKGLICPMHRKSMRDVCETCPLWRRLYGRDPQTGDLIDEWNCTLAWLPNLLIENAKESRETAAAVESFRNETVARQDAATERARQILQRQGPPAMKTIEVNNGS